jgi:Tfp pilus assembly protein PilW
MHNVKSQSGFTIIELLTAMAVFIFVIVAALGIYATTFQRHYEARGIQLVSEELRFVMELIARDIKDSYVIWGDTTSLYLAHPTKSKDQQACAQINKDQCLIYKIEGTTIKVRGLGDSDEFIPLTSSQLEIQTDTKFNIDANPNDALENPKVTILIKAKAAKTDPQGISEIYLQTTATQKEINNNFKGAPL